MKRVVLFLILMVPLLTGCATRGRLSLLDLDMREPAQIQAFTPEAAMPYSDKPTEPTVQAAAIPPTVWGQLVEVLKVIKFRIRIISIEWDKNV